MNSILYLIYCAISGGLVGWYSGKWVILTLPAVVLFNLWLEHYLKTLGVL